MPLRRADHRRLVHVGDGDGHVEVARQLERLRVPVVHLCSLHGDGVGLVGAEAEVGAFVVGRFLEAERAVRRVDLEAAMVAAGRERPRHAAPLRVRGDEPAHVRPAVLDDAEGAHAAAPPDHRPLVDVLNGDVERGRSRGVVFVLRRHRDAVGVLVLVIECGAAGDLDLP